MSEVPMDRRPEEIRRRRRETERSQHKKQGRVFTYLAILFAAAFLLLLMAYFMQQRAAEEAINGLTESVSSIYSLQTLIDTNKDLEAENQRLAQENEDLANELARLKQDHAQEQDASAKALEAMDYFRRIQMFYYAGSYRSARIVMEALEEAGLEDCLPTVTYYQNSDNSVLSPAEEYQRIHDALY